ncbi:MAG: YfcC family protein [Spirochaetales bacterium]|nr:YfcC family protein [Spirochaetales bacterium]
MSKNNEIETEAITEESPKSSIKIGIPAFLTAFSILLVLIIISGILTRVIPAGSYERAVVEGRQMVVEGSYTLTPNIDYPVWRWFTSPIEVIWGDNWLMVAVLTLFMVFIGGSFTILEKGRVMEALLALLVHRFEKRKYLLLAVITFVMMFMASVIGVYEALVPLIIFIVPLSLALGWDSLTGLGMTLLALSFGFAAAVTNPFTIAVAQKLADLPLYSGSWLRIIFFIVIYVFSLLFIGLHARKVEKNPMLSLTYREDEIIRHRYSPEKVMAQLHLSDDPSMKKAMYWFAGLMSFAAAFLLAAAFIPAIPTDYAFPIVALLFLLGGVGSGKFLRMSGGEIIKELGKGALNMLPGIVLILMAMSVPHIMTRGGVMDSILYQAAQAIQGTGSYLAGFLVYLLTLFLNFFISSASAKAFLVMPILTPLADLVGLTRQTVVLAFDLGDGFSNMIFPTNALLLIGLGFTVVTYPKWLRWTWKVQLGIFALSMMFLSIAVKIGFGPF